MYSKLITLLAASSLISLAACAPAASNEGVYLANCNEFEPGHLYSELDYYSNARSGSQNSQKPDASVTVDSSGYVTWEGRQVCGTFSGSGERFCSNIVGNGQSLATGAYAGSGYNNEEKFSCYKDNGRTLYTKTGIICKSVYYCYDA